MEKAPEIHIIKYRTYVVILFILLVFTLSSVAITQIDLGVYSVAAALIFACVKSILVLMYFMHLKFEKTYYIFMMGGTILVLISVILITFLDYLYR